MKSLGHVGYYPLDFPRTIIAGVREYEVSRRFVSDSQHYGGWRAA